MEAQRLGSFQRCSSSQLKLWEQHRRQARALEAELDDKLAAFSQLCARRPAACDQPTSAGGSATTFLVQVPRLLQSLSQLHDAMAAVVQTGDARCQMLERHRDIHQEFAAEFRRLSNSLGQGTGEAAAHRMPLAQQAHVGDGQEPQPTQWQRTVLSSQPAIHGMGHDYLAQHPGSFAAHSSSLWPESAASTSKPLLGLPSLSPALRERLANTASSHDGEGEGGHVRVPVERLSASAGTTSIMGAKAAPPGRLAGVVNLLLSLVWWRKGGERTVVGLVLLLAVALFMIYLLHTSSNDHE